MKIMTQNNNIGIWENIEIKRSASDAKKRVNDDLRISDSIIGRYLSPSAATPFPLEYAYHLLGNARGMKVLDYGCGAGENSALIATHGGIPVGVDISPDLIELAEKRMGQHGFEDYSFKVGSAHDLPLDDEYVDIVFGIAILHHLDLALASKEVFRVLKKGGRAIFFEPVRNSKLVWFIRNLIPYQSPDTSPYERPLTDEELIEFADPFIEYRARGFSLPFVNLIDTIGLNGKPLDQAIRVDGKILRTFPFLTNYASIRVFDMKKPD
jgi:SAM-dependent methyltransferase